MATADLILTEVPLHQRPTMTKLDTLVLDAAPLLTGTTSALLPLAEHFSTTSDVLGEIRDKTSRDLLANSQLSLKVQEPSPEAMLKGLGLFRAQSGLQAHNAPQSRILQDRPAISRCSPRPT